MRTELSIRILQSASPLPFLFIVALYPQIRALAQLAGKTGAISALTPFDVRIAS